MSVPADVAVAEEFTRETDGEGAATLGGEPGDTVRLPPRVEAEELIAEAPLA